MNYLKHSWKDTTVKACAEMYKSLRQIFSDCFYTFKFYMYLDVQTFNSLNGSFPVPAHWALQLNFPFKIIETICYGTTEERCVSSNFTTSTLNKNKCTSYLNNTISLQLTIKVRIRYHTCIRSHCNKWFWQKHVFFPWEVIVQDISQKQQTC